MSDATLSSSRATGAQRAPARSSSSRATGCARWDELPKDLSAHPFFSAYTHGFVRTAVCVPRLRVADPAFNVEQTVLLARQASDARAAVALFPEMGISAYSNDDLFQQDALLGATLQAIEQLVAESHDLIPVVVVGAPLQFDGRLYNCALAIYRGRVLGITPKTYVPNYREFYEKRQFAAARDAVRREVRLLGEDVPFGNDLIYDAVNLESLLIHTEICEDVWSPIPPSTMAALAGATILTNLSASNITVGKADYRKELCASQSAKCIAAYLYSASGPGESTTDLAWDGQALIYENGNLLAESERFAAEGQVILADVDLDRLRQDRMRLTTYWDSVSDYRSSLQSIRRIPFVFEIPLGELPLMRTVNRFPYVPSDPVKLDERCYEVYNIQVHGLMKRLEATGIENLVIGVSGGLDSTQALIVAARTMDRLELPRRNIHAFTMPGFATSTRTKRNAHGLMNALGVNGEEIDIRPACMQMLRDIGHPFADGEPVYDVTFENVQAGQRTAHLFRLANYRNGLVVGTGDLSELALGWATYGVGDHMSHYNVNASVPKTLIQYLIRWVATSNQFSPETDDVLLDILGTEISPELVPHESGTSDGVNGEPSGSRSDGVNNARSDQPAQSTEAKIGPYELQDFNLYYTSRFGYRPSKIAFLSYHAWRDIKSGPWPNLLPESSRHEYSLATITHWLEVFLYRFFRISQFKRSAIPNGPKVGSGGSLSPRGDWRAPSDSEVEPWLAELRENVPVTAE